jgi:hypothetical protein
MSLFCVLTCVVSFALHLPVSLNIHNQCKDNHLTSPVYFIYGGRWRVTPNQEIYVDAVMRSCIELDTRQDILEGALVYEVQRKHTESAQDESKSVWLLVAWKGEHIKELHMRGLLVEHNKRLDEDRLKRLYEKRWPLLRERSDATGGSWSLDDTTKLTTTIRVMNRGYKWDIFISEERK